MAASPAKVASSKPNPSTDGKPVQVKLVLLGEAAVGKSSVVLRFVQNDFQENKEPTIGAAFLTQKCRLEDKIIKFEIWDTAGQERFHSLAPMYYRNAQAAIVAYDITKSSSLDKAKSWVKELQHQGHANIVIALIGNKLDLVQSDADQSTSNGSSSSNADDEPDDATATPDNATSLPDSTAANPNLSSSSKRQVTKEEAEAYAQENNLLFFETSAKTGEGIVEVFTQIAGKIPLDVILSGRGNNNAGGRAGAANRGSGGAGGTNNTEDSRINLANNEEAKKDGCAC